MQHAKSPRLRGALGWAIAIGLASGIFLLYRWAEPTPPQAAPVPPPSAESNVTMKLENAPFIGHSNGFKTWSLWAGTIALERLPGASVTTIESVSLTNIRDGLLYPSPPGTAGGDQTPMPAHSPPGETALNRVPAEAEKTSGPWTARFHAGHGHYRSGMTGLPPPDLADLYRLQSEFNLTDGVDLRTREGDHFEAQSLTVLDLRSKRTGKAERRILCEDGMKVSRKNTAVTANQARYDVGSRTVECLGGARVTFPDGEIQTERMYWSLDGDQIRFPESSAGSFRGAPFTADGLVIDLKRRTAHANRIAFQLRNELQQTLKL